MVIGARSDRPVQRDRFERVTAWHVRVMEPMPKVDQISILKPWKIRSMIAAKLFFSMPPSLHSTPKPIHASVMFAARSSHASHAVAAVRGFATTTRLVIASCSVGI